MDLLICHLTRMTRPLICTAGINLATGRHVRPLPRSGRLNYDHLHSRGGVLRLGRVVRFESASPCGRRPEVEDTKVTFRTAGVVRDVPGAEFWERVTAKSSPGKDGLRGVFGPELLRCGATYASEESTGAASLGLVRLPADGVNLTVRERSQYTKGPQVRVNIAPDVLDAPAHGSSDLPATDIRFYGPDHTTVDSQAAWDVSILIRNSASVVLALGLSRPFAKQEGRRMHWLQVNGVFPEIDPLWGV